LEAQSTDAPTDAPISAPTTNDPPTPPTLNLETPGQSTDAVTDATDATEHRRTPPSLIGGVQVRDNPIGALCTECQTFQALDNNDLCGNCNARALNPGELGPIDPETLF
jgi:hypothetical protein